MQFDLRTLPRPAISKVETLLTTVRYCITQLLHNSSQGPYLGPYTENVLGFPPLLILGTETGGYPLSDEKHGIKWLHFIVGYYLVVMFSIKFFVYNPLIFNVDIFI